MKSNHFIRERSRKRGYILLLTLLTTSIMLAISFGIFALSLKEVVLASFIKRSALAFVAADRGAECALYFDRAGRDNVGNDEDNGFAWTIFATSSTFRYPPGFGGEAWCSGTDIVDGIPGINGRAWDVSPGDATSRSTTFWLYYQNNTRAEVTVAKSGDQTTITAHGFSSHEDSLRTTQRTIEITSNF